MNKTDKSNYWLLLVVLLCLGWVMIWLFRSVLSPIFPQVMATLNLNTKGEVSLIYTLYFLTYVIFQIPAGIISDKIDKKYVLGCGFTMFAIAIFFMSRTDNYLIVCVSSAIAGIAGAFYYGAAFALSSNEIPQSKRNLANAIINSGTAIGIVIGMNGSSYFVIVKEYGWQSLLLGVAIAVLITACIFLYCIKDNYRQKSSKETTLKANATQQVTETSSIADYFTPMKLCMYFVLFCSAYAYFLVMNWMPNFLQSERGFVGGQAGFFTSLIAIVSLPGALFFGVIADKFNHRKFSIMVVLLILASITLFLAVSLTNTVAIVACLVAYGFIGKLALDPLLISAVSEVSNKFKLATSLSVYNFFGMSASFVAPYLSGRIADKTNTMLLSFYLASGVLILGAVVIIITVIYQKNKVNS